MTFALEASEVNKIYDSNVHALNNLSLKVDQGLVYGLLGPNGAGKSSFLKIITGLIKPTSGSINLLGKNIRELNELKGKIGYVPQELVFEDYLTVEENLKLFASCFSISNPKERISELLKSFQLAEIRKRRAGTLSGGQKRRLNVAIGLVIDPEILILDEPSAGMDPQSRNLLWEMINDLSKKQDITIIISTHLMETADRLCTKIGIIDKGYLITEGTPEELKARYNSSLSLQITFKKIPDQNKKIEFKNRLKKIIEDCEIQEDEKSLAVRGSNLELILTKFIETSTEIIGISNIQGININPVTLEDVFIRLTGSNLREGK